MLPNEVPVHRLQLAPRSTRPPGKATVDDIVSELAADTDDGAALELAWWRTCPDGALPVLSPSSCC